MGNAQATTPNLRTNYTNNGLLKRAEKTRISRLLTNIVGRRGINVRNDGRTITISGSGRGLSFPWTKLAFGYSLSGAVCTIYPGAIRMHGIGRFELSHPQNVNLTGSVEWVYVELPRGSTNGTPPTISHSFGHPQTTSTSLRVPLYKFTASAPTVYVLDRICNMGDINLDTPIS